MPVKLDPIARAHLDRGIAHLATEFQGIFSVETVARFVEESIEQLGEARVSEFVPVLAHRFARSGCGRSGRPRARS